MKKRKQYPQIRNQQQAIPAGKVLADREMLAQAQMDRAYIHRMLNMETIRRIAGADGYSNAAASTGMASPLSASGTYVRSNLSRNPELLTTMYRENSLAMRIIDYPAEDMTRAWITYTGDMAADDLSCIKSLEAEHNIKGELTNAIRWARLYGGAIAVMTILGHDNIMDQPLEPEEVVLFAGLLVRDRTKVTPSMELEDNLYDPDYGTPMYYEVGMQDGRTKKIHHSRVLRFIGRELPDSETERESYWGASELEHVTDELDRYSSLSANIDGLAFKANLATLKLDYLGEMISLGTDEAKAKTESMVGAMTHMMSSTGMLLLNKDESLEMHPYSFDGLKDIHEAFMMDAAGAAEIPVTRLFGRSPAGMNATGEADMRNYYERIAGLQERMLRPALERLLPIMAASADLSLPDNWDFVFNPLETMTSEQKEDQAGKLTARVVAAINAGLISAEEGREEMKNIGQQIGAWTRLPATTKEVSHEEQ